MYGLKPGFSPHIPTRTYLPIPSTLSFSAACLAAKVQLLLSTKEQNILFFASST
jgi:hypothetical protein